MAELIQPIGILDIDLQRRRILVPSAVLFLTPFLVGCDGEDPAIRSQFEAIEAGRQQRVSEFRRRKPNFREVPREAQHIGGDWRALQLEASQ